MEGVTEDLSSNYLYLCEIVLRDVVKTLTNQQVPVLNKSIEDINAALSNIAQARSNIAIAYTDVHTASDGEQQQPPPQRILTFRNIVTGPDRVSIHVVTESGLILYDGSAKDSDCVLGKNVSPPPERMREEVAVGVETTGRGLGLDKTALQPNDRPGSGPSLSQTKCSPPDKDDTIRSLARERLTRQHTASLRRECSAFESPVQKINTGDTDRNLTLEDSMPHNLSTTKYTEGDRSGPNAEFILPPGGWVSQRLWSLLGNPSSAELVMITKMWNEGIVPTTASVRERMKNEVGRG